MTKPELKQFGEFDAEDFERHPIWVGCHTADYGKPWYEDTNESGEIVTSGFKNQPYCPCGKLYDDHTLFESIACGLAVQARVALELCPTCEKPIGQHAPEQIKACARKGSPPCNACNKPIGEHTPEEFEACIRKGKEKSES